uniref:116kDa U5 small nuclear ribonucleoprotein component N-terminal domain-containing protein n=1 Tax=Timema genevievae TaxID=629358 RepID=A0A7R9K8V9_TIMGE|nr:unnamed protein product [Timema genevievae]
MDADLYDEFGNYIGPELESEDEEEESFSERQPDTQEYDTDQEEQSKISPSKNTKDEEISTKARTLTSVSMPSKSKRINNVVEELPANHGEVKARKDENRLFSTIKKCTDPELSSKEIDLRAELSRRRAERLTLLLLIHFRTCVKQMLRKEVRPSPQVVKILLFPEAIKDQLNENYKKVDSDKEK